MYFFSSVPWLLDITFHVIYQSLVEMKVGATDGIEDTLNP
jgi:hypothetical protein